MRHASLFAFVLGMLLWTNLAWADGRPLIAVLNFNGTQAKLTAAEALSLTGIARKAALDQLGGRYDIITRENLVDLLKSHGKTLEKCQGECETETGRLIGADVVVTGTVRKAFGSYTLEIKAHRTSPPKLLGFEQGRTKNAEELFSLVTDGATKLYGQLRGKASLNPDRRSSGAGSGGGSAGGWQPDGGAGVLVRFESTPTGAVVMVDGAMTCQSTPCQKELAAGSHTVEMHKDKYVSARSVRGVKAGDIVHLKLQSNFGYLRVVSAPAGLPATVDGKPVGVTPTGDLEMSLGPHRVEVKSPCHYNAWTESSVARGERQEVKLSPEAKPAGLRVMAKDEAGNDLAADVYVDGKKVGQSPGTFTVGVCAKILKVNHAEHGSYEQSLQLREKRTSLLSVTLSRGSRNGIMTLDAFRLALFDDRAKAIQARMSNVRLRKRGKLEQLVNRHARNANRADHLFRLAETWREETKYQYLLSREKYEQAYECFEEKRCAQEPPEPEEDLTTALMHYRRIMQEHPDYRRMDEVIYHLGRASLDTGKARKNIKLQKEGVRRLEELLREHPKSRYVAQAHLALGEHFFTVGSASYGKAHYSKIVLNFKGHPLYNWAVYKLGWVHFKLGEFAMAAKYLKALMTRIPGGADGIQRKFLKAVRDGHTAATAPRPPP